MFQEPGDLLRLPLRSREREMAILSAPIPTPYLSLSVRRRGRSLLHLPSSRASFSPSQDRGLELQGPCAGPRVFVAAPLNAAEPTGAVARRKLLRASFLALSMGGVHGVTLELWWGLVEGRAPGAYDWGSYLDLVALARHFRLKVRVVAAFHQRGSGPSDPCWLPLPQWILDEMEKNPDLAYTDRFGRRNKEYISLGCDTLPVLKGRTPIQVYSDFLRSFRDTFGEYLGETITEIQIGMGPSGELRYPSFPSEKLRMPGSAQELGEFQCYDKFMIDSLNAHAKEIEKLEWGDGGPIGAWSLSQDLEKTSFFKQDGSWNSSYGHFFLNWYSEMLIHHGERLCLAAATIFLDTGVRLLGKLAGVHWHYRTSSHPSELTAGYYNTVDRDGYIPITKMFARHKITLCYPGFELSDLDEGTNSKSSPEGLLRQVMHAVKSCNVPLSGENSKMRLDETSLNKIIKNVRIHTDGFGGSFVSFNFVRMNKHLFEAHNFQRFTRFVRQMSEIRTVQAILDAGGSGSCALLPLWLMR